MNNTGTDQPPALEPAAGVETPTEVETPASDAAPVELAGPAVAVPLEPATAATSEAKPAKKIRKSRTPAETAAPEAVPAASAAADAAPAEPPTPATEPVASPEMPAAMCIETDAPGSKLSAIDAAAKVLGEAGRPMTCQEMIDAMAAKGYWHSPGGKTPARPFIHLYFASRRSEATKPASPKRTAASSPSPAESRVTCPATHRPKAPSPGPSVVGVVERDAGLPRTNWPRYRRT